MYVAVLDPKLLRRELAIGAEISALNRNNQILTMHYAD